MDCMPTTRLSVALSIYVSVSVVLFIKCFQLINFISTSRFTEPVTILCCRNTYFSFYTVLNVFGVKRSNFVTVCTDNRGLTAFLWQCFGTPPMLSKVYSTRTPHVCYSAICKMEPDVRILFTSRYGRKYGTVKPISGFAKTPVTARFLRLS
jgi:hypothetical protein